MTTNINAVKALKAAREAVKKAKEEGTYIPPERNPLLQAKDKPSSKVAAIKAKCAECMGCTEEHIESGWRNMIRDCTSVACPLHSHRPYK